MAAAEATKTTWKTATSREEHSTATRRSVTVEAAAAAAVAVQEEERGVEGEEKGSSLRRERLEMRGSERAAGFACKYRGYIR